MADLELADTLRRDELRDASRDRLEPWSSVDWASGRSDGAPTRRQAEVER